MRIRYLFYPTAVTAAERVGNDDGGRRWRPRRRTAWTGFAAISIAVFAALLGGGAGAGDNQRPRVTIVTPAGDITIDSTRSTASFSGTAVDADGSVERVEYRVNGGTWRLATDTTNWSFTATGLVPSGNAVVVRAFDDQGADSAEARREVFREISRIPPVVSVDEPAGDRTLAVGRTGFAFSGSASDADGSVSQVQYRVNSGPWRPADGLENWTFDAEGFTAGVNIVVVRALDQQFLTSDEVIRRLSPQAPPDAPTLRIDAPGGARILASTSTPLRFQGSAAAGVGALVRVEYRLNQADDWRAAGGTAQWSFVLDDWAAGDNLVQVRALDDGGRFSAADAREVRVDAGAAAADALFRDQFESDG